MSIKFEAGINIVIKIPKATTKKAVAFNRYILKMESKKSL